MPASIASWMPASIDEMYSRGTAPPTILFSNTYPPPGSFGAMSMTTWPYWPRPPVWRTKRPCTPCTALRIVSR